MPRAPEAPATDITRWRYDYSPFPRQAQAHAVFADEVFFGGAAGGGKTDALIAEAISMAFTFKGSATGIFRREFPDLSQAGGIIPRMLARIPASIATYNITEHRWKFRNGSIIEFGHFSHASHIQSYMGAEWQLLLIDQLEQFAAWEYRMLRGRLRASGKLAGAMAAAGIRPWSFSTGNPGGVGHGWLKTRFIDPAPPDVVWQPDPTEDELEPGTRVFIPSRHTDNPALDESYRQRLRSLPEDERRALEEGDWDVFTGQRFRDFRRDIHVIDPEDLPVGIGAGITRAVGVDYGLDRPFAALWGAKLPDNLVVVYRETGGPGLTPEQQAKRILAVEAPGERTPGRPVPVYLDPSTWARNPAHPKPVARSNVPPRGSIAWHYVQAGLPVRRADNDRLGGVALVADKLRVRADGQPRLYIYSTCLQLIRTLPALVRDPARPEDVDTRGDDDWYDSLRYLLKALESMPAGELGARSIRRPGSRSAGETVTGSLRKKEF